MNINFIKIYVHVKNYMKEKKKRNKNIKMNVIANVKKKIAFYESLKFFSILPAK